MRVLVVDDDLDSADSLADLLQLVMAPASVMVANDGAEGLAAATAPMACFDAIVTDIEMPGMDGATAAKEIKRALGDATPLIIAVTGHGDFAGHGEIERAFDHLLLKPVAIDVLVALLQATTTSGPKRSSPGGE